MWIRFGKVFERDLSGDLYAYFLEVDLTWSGLLRVSYDS